MSNILLDAEILGVEELRLKLTDPELAAPLKGLLKEAINIGRDASRQALGARGTGMAARTMLTRVRPMMATVYSAMSDARIKSMHDGRPVGTELPIRVVASWVLGDPHLRRVESSDYGRVKSAQKAIREGGAKATPFFPQARAAIENALPGLLSKMMTAIRERFDK